jgi:ParB-like chromosome segregation protein Spo0J
MSKACNKLYRTTEALRVEDVYIYGDRRALRNETISELAESMDRIGLKIPISVRIIPVDEDSGDYYLITGAHRLAAAKKLGWEFIECFVVENESDDQAKLWEIAENLHRAELSVLERARHISEWIRITDKLAQSAPVSKGGRGNEGGINKAARELGLDRTEAQRATKIAGLTPEAQKVAVEVGLDGNANALLAAKDKSGDAAKEIENLRASRARKDAADVVRKSKPATTFRPGNARHVLADIEAMAVVAPGESKVVPPDMHGIAYGLGEKYSISELQTLHDDLVQFVASESKAALPIRTQKDKLLEVIAAARANLDELEIWAKSDANELEANALPIDIVRSSEAAAAALDGFVFLIR